jgi:hypothetical protein
MQKLLKVLRRSLPHGGKLGNSAIIRRCTPPQKRKRRGKEEEKKRKRRGKEEEKRRERRGVD